jgi:hypothetical protein
MIHGEKGRRTGQLVHILSALGFVSPTRVADELVASGEEDDAEEGEEEGEGGCYAPEGEDDAEVLGGEGEEHLLVGRSAADCSIGYRYGEIEWNTYVHLAL